MTRDSMDAFLRAHRPSAEVAPERVERVIDSVMARLDDAPVRATAWGALRRRFALPTMPRLIGAYAVPISMAAVLGIAVGRGMAPGADVWSLSDVIVASTMTLAGF